MLNKCSIDSRASPSLKVMPGSSHPVVVPTKAPNDEALFAFKQTPQLVESSELVKHKAASLWGYHGSCLMRFFMRKGFVPIGLACRVENGCEVSTAGRAGSHIHLHYGGAHSGQINNLNTCNQQSRE